MIYTILIVLIVIISFLLTLVVLLQSGQGQGLTGIAASGMMGNSGLGARRTADLLSKATSIFGAAFLILCVVANFAIEKQGSQTRSILQGSGIAPIENLDAPAQTPAAVPQQTPPAGGSDNSESDN